MAKELNRFLSPTDAAFLYLEKPTETMHIGGTMVYQGRMERSELLQLLAERLPSIPRYRQRVVFPPMAVSHPLWIDDPDFDLERHVDQIDLADSDAEVDDRTLAETAARAYSGALPRDRPLWHATVINGLPDDNTAIVWKIHHAMIDGVSGVDLTLALNEVSPDPKSYPTPPPWNPGPLPDPIDLAQEAVEHRLNELAGTWTRAAFGLMRPNKVSSGARRLYSALARTLPTALQAAPTSPFNHRVSGRLGYAWADFSFAEMRQIKNEFGGTLNDLVLTVLSGAIRRYVQARGGKIEDREMRAMCPVSMRSASQHGDLGNLVSVMLAPLPYFEDDPRERHRLVRGGMEQLKETGQADALFSLSQLGNVTPPLVQALTSRVVPEQRLFNTVSTNVPGPQIPLFQNGRQLLHWYPMGIVSNNIGLFVAILTYNRRMVMAPTVDVRQIEDPWQFVQCLYDSQKEIREAAGVDADQFPLAPPRPRPAPSQERSASPNESSGKVAKPTDGSDRPATASQPDQRKTDARTGTAGQRTTRKKTRRRTDSAQTADRKSDETTPSKTGAAKKKVAKKKVAKKKVAKKKVTKKKATKKASKSGSRKKATTRKKASKRTSKKSDESTGTSDDA